MKMFEVDNLIFAMIICGSTYLDDKVSDSIAKMLMEKETLLFLNDKASKFIYTRLIKDAKKEKEESGDVEKTVKWIPFLNYYMTFKDKFGTEDGKLSVSKDLIGLAAIFAVKSDLKEAFDYFCNFMSSSKWVLEDGDTLFGALDLIENPEILSLLKRTTSGECKATVCLDLISAVGAKDTEMVESILIESSTPAIEMLYVIAAGLSAQLKEVAFSFADESLKYKAEKLLSAEKTKTYTAEVAA